MGDYIVTKDLQKEGKLRKLKKTSLFIFIKVNLLLEEEKAEIINNPFNRSLKILNVTFLSTSSVV
jgi:hypothetical protein